MSAIELNRLIQRAVAYEDAARQLASLDRQLIEQYDLTEPEKDVLKAPTPERLAQVGVHPMLAMWLMILRSPEITSGMDAGEYFRDQEDVQGG